MHSRHSISGLLGTLVLGLMYANPVMSETIAMVGTGNVGSSLGPMFAELGHEIIYATRSPDRADIQELVSRTGGNASAALPAEAAARADVVMLAVPWNTVEAVMANIGDLSGKIVIDPTNPRMVGDDGLRDFAVDPSNAEWVQRWAPEARVVKAFNTMNYRTWMDPASSGGPVTVPIVGDDAEAKAFVASLVEGVGLEPIDLGPLRYANALETLYIIWGNARTLGTPFNYHFRLEED